MENKVVIKETDLQIIRDMQAEIDEYHRFVEWLFFAIVKGDIQERIKFGTQDEDLLHTIANLIANKDA